MAADIIARYGSRLSGTAANRAARGALLALLGEARAEGFPIHPGSLFRIGKVFAVSYHVGIIEPADRACSRPPPARPSLH